MLHSKSSSSSFAAMVSTICAHLNYDFLEVLSIEYADRLAFGVGAELVPLMEVPRLRAETARILFSSGIKTPQQLSICSEQQIEALIRSNRPFHSRQIGQEELQIVHSEQLDWIHRHAKRVAVCTIRNATRFVAYTKSLPRENLANCKSIQSPPKKLSSNALACGTRYHIVDVSVSESIFSDFLDQWKTKSMQKNYFYLFFNTLVGNNIMLCTDKKKFIK